MPEQKFSLQHLENEAESNLLNNNMPTIENLKKAIIDFVNREYNEQNAYANFDNLYPDAEHVAIATTTSVDQKHRLIFELNLVKFTWAKQLDDTILEQGSYLPNDTLNTANISVAIRHMILDVEAFNMKDLLTVNVNLLQAKTGLGINQNGEIYDPLGKDLDNDGIIDRYDYNPRSSDYFTSTYQVEKKESIMEYLANYKAQQNLAREQVSQGQERSL